MVGFRQQIRHMLGCVTRGVSRGHSYLTELEAVAVLNRLVFKSVLRAAFVARINFRRFNPIAKLARTAYQIGVNVSLENMRNGKAGFAGDVHIHIYICSRIKNCPHSFVIVTEQIRKLGDSVGLNCFKNE